jgi:hypothetical protein
MPSTSAQRGFSLPTVGGDIGAWGTELNNGVITTLDNILGTQTVLHSSAGTSITISSSLSTSGQLVVDGAPGTTVTLTFSSSNYGNGQYVVNNQMTDGSAITCTTSNATYNVSVPGSTTTSFFSRTVWVNGSGNVFPADAIRSNAAIEWVAVGGGNPIPAMNMGLLEVPYTMYPTLATLYNNGGGTVSVNVFRYVNYPNAQIQEISSFTVNSTYKATTTYPTSIVWNAGDTVQCNINSASSNIGTLSLSVRGYRSVSS